jgi:hypothetical protein
MILVNGKGVVKLFFLERGECGEFGFEGKEKEDKAGKAIYLRRLLLAAFSFDISAEFIDPVGLGQLGLFWAGGPGGVFRRTVQDDDDHLRFFRFPFFFLGAGGNLLPELGIEFQKKVHQLPEGLG